MKLGLTILFGTGVGILVGIATAQGPPSRLLMNDKGIMVSSHQHHHRKRGEAVTWGRQTGAQKSWFVIFDKPERSPCVEGTTFGSDQTQTTCTIRSDAVAGSYRYSSSTCSSCPKNDPDIIVDE